MKIIDADRLLNTLREYKYITDDVYNDTNILEDIINDEPSVDAIVIPKDATNQDVAKIVFGNQVEELFPSADTLIVERFMPYCKAQLHKDWLDMPYIKNHMGD